MKANRSIGTEWAKVLLLFRNKHYFTQKLSFLTSNILELFF